MGRGTITCGGKVMDCFAEEKQIDRHLATIKVCRRKVSEYVVLCGVINGVHDIVKKLQC